MASQQSTADVSVQTRAAEHTTLRGRWLLVARVAWVAFAVLAVGLFVAALPYAFRELQTVCAESDDCRYGDQLMPEDAEALEELSLSVGFYARYVLSIVSVVLIGFVLIPAVIFWRRSDDWMAMLVSLALVLFGTTLPRVVPLLEEAQPALELVVDFVRYLAAIFVVLGFLLFPSGRFVPRWTRFVGLGVILMGLISFTAFVVPQGGGNVVADGLIRSAIVIALPIGVFAQIYRYRGVSDPVGRQQVKWVVFALIAAVLGFSVGVIAEETVNPGRAAVLNKLIGIPLFFAVPSLLVPGAIAFSILRYRLWDIDVVLNRALVYGALTAMLASTYIGSVVLLQMAFRGVTGQGNAVAIVISTLTIAALFMPLRRLIQNVIDRRFFRRRYDAARTVAAFATSMRDEVDVERLTRELVTVVEDTMQPAHVSLWLRSSRGMASGEHTE